MTEVPAQLRIRMLVRDTHWEHVDAVAQVFLSGTPEAEHVAASSTKAGESLEPLFAEARADGFTFLVRIDDTSPPGYVRLEHLVDGDLGTHTPEEAIKLMRAY